MIEISLNGERHTLADGTTLAMLLERLSGETGRDPRGIAVERNREIVPKSQLHLVVLADGDAIELVQFVGGG